MTDLSAEALSVSSSVEVPVDPGLAFKVFIEEVDLWWVRGPINHMNAGRMLAKRIEAGVGGRVLEVYDDTTSDALELARVTVWEPGSRLARQSSIDDVETEIFFEPSSLGTTVRVVATIPPGGADRGGTSWVRVVPRWLAGWCARRDAEPHVVRDLALLALGVSYVRPAAAAAGWPRSSDSSPTKRCPMARTHWPKASTGTPGSSFGWATRHSWSSR